MEVLISTVTIQSAYTGSLIIVIVICTKKCSRRLVTIVNMHDENAVFDVCILEDCN